MNLLQVYQGSKFFGTRCLFEKATFSIDLGEHIGVIGANGAGKTTLFKILVDEMHLDEGEIIKSSRLKVGYLEQESEWRLDQTSEEFLTHNCTKPIWQIKKLGFDLGLTEEHFVQPLHELSGGYRMRMKLLYLIGQEPNLMLLDEPTNFLDLESILALEKFLQNYVGAFLLISHDREFLRRTTDSTIEIETPDVTKYSGNIDDYFEQKAQLRETLEAQAANQEIKRKQIQDFVDKFRAKATKAKQAQSRMKLLEKMEKIELKDLPVRAHIHIPPPTHTGKEVLHLQDANLGYGQKMVLQSVNIRLEKGKHLGVVGFNGAGKSTLLKSLAQKIPLLKGSLKLGHQVSFSYFAQHSTDTLNLEQTVLEALQDKAHSEIKAQEILNLAGSLLFSGDAVHKKIKVLSGGEKSRVALGQMLLQKSPLLLLDEPTNHLDFDTVEALTEALRDYAGSLVVISHDRSFIGRVANQILEIRDGSAHIYPGSYDDYVWSLEKGAMRVISDSAPLTPQTVTAPVSTLTSQPTKKINYKEETKRLQNKIRELQRMVRVSENRIESLCQKREETNTQLIQAQGPLAQTLARELGYCSMEVERTESELLEHLEALDLAEKELTHLKNHSTIL